VHPTEPCPDNKFVDNDDEIKVEFVEEPTYDPMTAVKDTKNHKK